MIGPTPDFLLLERLANRDHNDPHVWISGRRSATPLRSTIAQRFARWFGAAITSVPSETASRSSSTRTLTERSP